MINHWWVTRPKRRLTSIPEILGAYINLALTKEWQGDVGLQRNFEAELERAGLKRIGDRRDRRGSGGRTYQAWLASLGLVFIGETSKKVFLTLAGEAIMKGESPVAILKNQILKYQFPSPFSLASSMKNRVSERFKIRPFPFLLKLLSDVRVQYLTQDEIAFIVMVEAENETDRCYENVVRRVLEFRERGTSALDENFEVEYAPFSRLTDCANTIVNWLDYTQLVYREGATVQLLDEKKDEVKQIIESPRPFIDRPEETEYFQRKYGLPPGQIKDTRNLSKTQTITPRIIETQKIKQAFIAASLREPIGRIAADIIDKIAEQTGVDEKLVEDVLNRFYPNGALGGFMTEYFEMAFKGQDDAIQFEKATARLFRNAFGFQTVHLGQSGGKPTPDVLLLSDEDGYQAIIDNKAYSRYSISNDHRNRMVRNYIENFRSYSNDARPLAFFSYIAGGFARQFDAQLRKIVEETSVHGSGATVSNIIKLVEKQNARPFTHRELRELFSLDRQILAKDF